MSDGTVTIIVDGYTVIAGFSSFGGIQYTVNNPDGSELIRAGDAFGLSTGLTTLFHQARDAGNTELADQLFQLNKDLSGQEASIQQQVIDANKPPQPPAPVTPPADTASQTSQQNDVYVASGGANDDSGSVQRFDDGSSIQTASDGSTLVTDNSGSVTSTASNLGLSTLTRNISNASTTVAGKSDSPAATASNKSGPGKRLQNPLGNFSSYTYQISLYMITPDAYNSFVQSGRKNINAYTQANGTGSGNGAFLVAQSGGVNNSTQLRAPYFDQDFFIDNLRITQAISGKDTGSESNVTDMSFTITEPYGFSFLTRLRDAFTQLLKVSSSPNIAKSQDPSRQFFILGIQFLGYNEDGSVISAKDMTGINADPNGNSFGVYARYYDISITELHFSLQGKAVTYACKAVNSATMSSMGLKRGILWSGAEVYGQTVDDVLQGDGDSVLGLFTKANKEQEELVKNKKIGIANQYEIVYLGDSLTNIADAKIVSPADVDKLKWKMSDATSTKQSNEKTAQQSTPNKNINKIKFDNGTPLSQAIQQIIKQSTYLTDALKSVITTEQQPNPETDENGETVDPAPKVIRWYNLGTEIEVLGYDDVQKDFAYKIKYIIQPYETPVVSSAYVNHTANYYGPVKRYEYWFTGKNSEVIKYEQTLNNTFFNVTLDPEGSTSGSGGGANIPVINGIPQKQAKSGLLNQGMEAQNSYMTSLFDDGAWSSAKITILGDPDFLMQPNPSSSADVYNQYYGTDGFTVSANGGQVFIEINFREPVDYNNENGLYTINSNIAFYKYPPKLQADINSRGGGVSYMVKTVVSTFNQGKFTQELDLNITTFGDETSTDQATQANADSKDNRAGKGDSQKSTGTVSAVKTVGFKKETTTIDNTAIPAQSINIGPGDPTAVNVPSDQNTAPAPASPPEPPPNPGPPSVTVNGYTFTTLSSGAVVVHGPGIPSTNGLDNLGQVGALDPNAFINYVKYAPNLSDAAKAALTAFSNDPQAIGSIQSGLGGQGSAITSNVPVQNQVQTDDNTPVPITTVAQNSANEGGRDPIDF